jgi:hypothetical protein
MMLLLFRLFVGDLPFMGFMAHDTSANGSNHGMMASIMTSDCSGGAAAQATYCLGLRGRPDCRDQGDCDNGIFHESLHSDQAEAGLTLLHENSDEDGLFPNIGGPQFRHGRSDARPTVINRCQTVSGNGEPKPVFRK